MALIVLEYCVRSGDSVVMLFGVVFIVLWLSLCERFCVGSSDCGL